MEILETSGRRIRFRRIRLAALLIFLLKSFPTIAQIDPEDEPDVSCGGVERWAVKTLTDAAAPNVNFTPVQSTVAALVAINTPFPNPNMPRVTGLEYTTYQVTCNLTVKKIEADSDYHLVLSNGAHTLIAEIPDPICSPASNSVKINNFIAARNFIDQNLPPGDVYSLNLPPVTVSGVAFVDPPHGQLGAAPNNLELHPVLSIHFAPPTEVSQDMPPPKSYSLVYPNPFTEETNLVVYCDLPPGELASLKIYDCLGTLIREEKLPPSESGVIHYKLRKDGLSEGIYLYQVWSPEGSQGSGKLIVR